MLFTQYPIITQHYFVLSFVVCLGTLQWAAARNQTQALSIFGRKGLGRGGRVSGLLLVCGGFGWFFMATPGLFRPGLAGGELTLLFSAGSLSALVLARLAGAFWQWLDRCLSKAHGL
jgi:hypothetical protein